MRSLYPLLVLIVTACSAQTEPPKLPPLPDSVMVEPNLAYDQYKETVIDVFYPKARAAGKRPAAIVIHGGGWRGGDKQRMVQTHVLPYVEKGFVVANVEYRLAKVAAAPAAVTDVLKAADWFADNAKRWGVDNKRIVVTGTSAGGHLALMVGMTPKSAKLGPAAKVAVVVNFYGITDVEDQLQGPNRREYAVEWIPEQAGRFELARRVSPMTYVRKDVPAILSIHGNADQTVPYEHAVNLTKALRDEGADAEMIPVPNGGHGFPPETLQKIYPQIFEFLQRRGVLK
ncbi:MAG: alpha/beta hydrolase [Acidobacteria bacterium]|nr:alpha/beta hydrolase [Acidobacteriota bacterium]